MRLSGGGRNNLKNHQSGVKIGLRGVGGSFGSPRFLLFHSTLEGLLVCVIIVRGGDLGISHYYIVGFSRRRILGLNLSNLAFKKKGEKKDIHSDLALCKL